ncbi:hypothetical protein [Aeromicrobium endophyticum]|uniref:Uncharacterized protein n=1 Tax=Aeromicrobium endophyticum TaxID=2292704 RepID=A0A371PBY1_9ACTN|nr:hypothetical protein [Aeromicrobium endophyticum]REK73387.1 hypothetical protein DX116_07505 [Aeromicrobium endophyticum]
MVDEQQPPRRVVKKVVKKTVVRPGAPRPAAEPAPTIRYGRPVATAARPAPKAKAAPSNPSAPAPRTGGSQTRRPMPTIDVRARTAGARDVAGRAWWATADQVSVRSRTAGRFVAGRARAAAAWRLPHVNPYLASVVTGAVVGLVAVLLAALSLQVFEAVRGVSSGGGLWGGLTFVTVAVVCLFAGEALLRGFGTPSARLTSFLAVILAIIAMLGLFIDLLDGVAGLAIVPLIGVAGYALSHWLVDLAEQRPHDE